MNIVIFGPPGAGKGTQSKYIVKKFNLFQLSTGELLRNEIINKTQLGINISSTMNSGNLVSDKIVSDLIEIYISNNDYNDRLIFDGYPRNISQAENLNLLLNKYNKKIEDETKVINRNINFYIDENYNFTYNNYSNEEKKILEVEC